MSDEIFFSPHSKKKNYQKPFQVKYLVNAIGGLFRGVWESHVCIVLNNLFHGAPGCPFSRCIPEGTQSSSKVTFPKTASATLAFWIFIFQGKKYFPVDSRKKQTPKQRSKFCYFERLSYICAIPALSRQSLSPVGCTRIHSEVPLPFAPGSCCASEYGAALCQINFQMCF